MIRIVIPDPEDGVSAVMLAGPRPDAELGRPVLTLRVDLLDGPLSVTYRLIAFPPGQLAVIEMRQTVPLEPGHLPESVLTAEALSHVRIGDYVRFLDLLLPRLRRHPGQCAQMRQFGFGFLIDGPPPRSRRRKRRPGAGRPPLSDALLARAARLYLDALKRKSDRPVLDAAVRLHERPERVRDFLNRARRNGLLTRLKIGIAGGRLTPRGWAALRARRKAK